MLKTRNTTELEQSFIDFRHDADTLDKILWSYANDEIILDGEAFDDMNEFVEQCDKEWERFKLDFYKSKGLADSDVEPIVISSKDVHNVDHMEIENV